MYDANLQDEGVVLQKRGWWLRWVRWRGDQMALWLKNVGYVRRNKGE